MAINAAGLRDRAAQLAANPEDENAINQLALQLQALDFPPAQQFIVDQALENIHLAWAALFNQQPLGHHHHVHHMGDDDVALPQEQFEDQLIDDDNGFLNLFPDQALAHQHLEQQQEPQDLHAMPEVYQQQQEENENGQAELPNQAAPAVQQPANQPPVQAPIAPPPQQAAAVTERPILDRIREAVTTALQTFVTWILSFVFCMPRAVANINPAPNAQPEALQQPLPAAQQQQAALPAGKIQGQRRLEDHQLGRNCNLEFANAFWDHLQANRNLDQIPALIDQTLQNGAEKPPVGNAGELFPRVQGIQIPELGANQNYLEQLNKLDLRAIMNRNQKMVVCFIVKGEESHLLLVDARTRGQMNYYHYNPQANPAYLQAYQNKQAMVDHLNEAVPIVADTPFVMHAATFLPVEG